MDFGNLREMLVKIGNDKKLCMSFRKKIRCIPLGVFNMTSPTSYNRCFPGSSIWRLPAVCNRRFLAGIHSFLLFPIFIEYSRTFQKCISTSHDVFWDPLNPCCLKTIPCHKLLSAAMQNYTNSICLTHYLICYISIRLYHFLNVTSSAKSCLTEGQIS